MSTLARNSRPAQQPTTPPGRRRFVRNGSTGSNGSNIKQRHDTDTRVTVNTPASPPPLPTAMGEAWHWIQKSIVGPGTDLGRLELAHQLHVLKRVYDRQPRHFGHFVLKLISTVEWIPRYLFDACCELLKVSTTFVIQLLDLLLSSLFCGLFGFPWASTLFYGLLVTFPRVPYTFWQTGNFKGAAVCTLLYTTWAAWMIHVYINKPERWLGYARSWLITPGEILVGPYLWLFLAAGTMLWFEYQPITDPLFLSPHLVTAVQW
ncbi:hypothetical protein BKA67DRAFT_670407 [Truncatella angustata]|uniref:Uncharacterized protein n=1 Tax=Truncatella angustata TaxID=152316 RepID=A0A9P8UB34_9PEZI|nr:uncharacterized protein BKA67DRAFT_670407 [Truncatella angustata]KAH6644931.1 hypothetical protein BKA67DRAFT_670407 [Truncatella angustata]